MNRISKYLEGLCRGVFKLLPMQEGRLEGDDNHIDEYLQNLIINIRGGCFEYEQLKENNRYLDVISKLQFLLHEDAKLKEWKSIILSSCNLLTKLSKEYSGVEDG